MNASAEILPMEGVPVDHAHPAPAGVQAKWAAVVDDTLIPMPRRKVRGSLVLAQAGQTARTLLRDYNQPMDVPIDPAAEIDLAQGNVFRTVDTCEPAGPVTPTNPPKLAFVADDAWEITTNPNQTLQMLRELFGLPVDAQVFRDFESPHDQVIAPGETVHFADGPVFRTRIVHITVKVNNNPVKFTKRRVSALELKQTAIAQGVPIDVGCVVYQVKPDGLGPAIPDDHVITLKCGDEFRCIAPDDNS